MQTETDHLVDDMRNQQPTICVQGAIVPQTDMEFVLPRVIRDEANDLIYSDQAATIKIQPGSDQGQRTLLLCSAEGEETQVLRAVQIVVDDGLARPILIGRRRVIEMRIERLGLRLRLDNDVEGAHHG